MMQNLSILSLFFSMLYAKDLNMGHLSPGITLYNQTLLPSDRGLYTISEMQSSTSYEIKISYPASSPTDFKFQWNKKEISSSNLRRRLNTEKQIVHTPITSLILIATPTGVSTTIDTTARPSSFNIEIEEMRYGIPLCAFRLIAVAIVQLTVALLVLLPMVKTYIVRQTVAHSRKE